MKRGARLKRYLIVAVCLPNFFDGGEADGKSLPCRIGSDIVPSNSFHHAQKCVDAWGVKWRLLYPSSPWLSPDSRGVLQFEGRVRERGDVREMEKWMKSERNPANESMA
jgi:hypothetical protein